MNNKTLAVRNGEIVTIVSVNGGWTTFVDEVGATRKDRNSNFDKSDAAISVVQALAEQARLDAADRAMTNSNHPEILDCDQCNESFLSADALAEHVENTHTNPQPTPRPSLAAGIALIARGGQVAKCGEVLERRAEKRETAKKEAEKKERKVRITASNIAELTCCPRCGSEDIHTAGGENDELTRVCEKCDWAIDLRDRVAKLKPDFSRYVAGKGTTASGRNTLDTDDYVAAKLRGMDLEEIFKYVAKMLAVLGVTTIGSGKNKSEASLADLHARYDHLNVGMRRMNLGNVLRGAMKRLNMETLPEDKDGE